MLTRIHIVCDQSSSRLDMLYIYHLTAGFSFGANQGLISIILVMPQFLRTFPETDSAVTSEASFNKG